MATKKKGVAKKAKKAKKFVVAVSETPSPQIEGGGTRTYPLDFILPPDLPLLYVDNINIVHTASEFVVSFMQAQPPIFITDEQMKSTKSIQTKVVARIIVSPLKMEQIVRTFVGNFQTYVKTYLKPEEPDGERESAISDKGATGQS